MKGRKPFTFVKGAKSLGPGNAIRPIGNNPYTQRST